MKVANNNFIFVDADCLKKQLGKKYAGHLLYSPNEINKLIDKPINEIDIIAKHKKLGFKLKDNNQGNYRFSEKDIKVIQNTKVNYCEKINAY